MYGYSSPPPVPFASVGDVHPVMSKMGVDGVYLDSDKMLQVETNTAAAWGGSKHEIGPEAPTFHFE